MTISSISDLQMSLIGRRQNANLRTELAKLTEEISSGQVSNIRDAISGNAAPLSSVERSLNMLDGYEFSAGRVDLKFSYAATALEVVQQGVSGLGPEVLSALQSGDVALDPVLNSAEQNFQNAVSALQARVGGQFVFSGLNSESSSLISAEEMLGLLRAEVSGVTDPADFVDTVERWFNEPGGGFETSAYQGGAQSTVDVIVSATVVIDDMYTADRDEIRSTLRDLAMVTLISEGAFSGDDDAKYQVLQTVGANLLVTDDQLTSARASLGREQQKVSEAIIQIQSERYVLNQARNEIVGVDVFEAAGRLEEVQTQLESLYLITARTSRLNLTEYLR